MKYLNILFFDSLKTTSPSQSMSHVNVNHQQQQQQQQLASMVMQSPQQQQQQTDSSVTQQLTSGGGGGGGGGYDHHFQVINTTAENMNMLSSLNNKTGDVMLNPVTMVHNPAQFHLTQYQLQPTMLPSNSGLDATSIVTNIQQPQQQQLQQNSRTQSPTHHQQQQNGANVLLNNGPIPIGMNDTAVTSLIGGGGNMATTTTTTTTAVEMNTVGLEQAVVDMVEKRHAREINVNLTLDEKLKNYMVGLLKFLDFRIFWISY